MITSGVDVGSLTAKVVILDDNEIRSWSCIKVSPDCAETAKQAMDEALRGTGLSLENIEYIVSTGYGRVVVPFTNRSITEISCHARGAHWFFPGVRSILDMGGQDCKAIRCDDNGRVTSFVMNDKCAGGTGRYVEIIAEMLELPLDDIGRLSLEEVKGPATVSSMCAVFAKTEVMSLVRRGEHNNDVLAGVCDAIAKRVATLMERVGVEEEFVIAGGIAKNIGVVTRLEKLLGVKAKIAFEPQIVGALGAALFARDALVKQQAASSATLRG